MLKINIIICTMFIRIITSKLCAQDPQFSQFYATPLYTNPAKAGTDFLGEQQTARLGLQYLNSWGGLFKTINLSYDQKIDKLHGAIGFNANIDGAGTSGMISTNRYEFNYVLHSKVSRKYNINLNSSLSMGLGSRRFINNSRIVFGDNIYPDTFSTQEERPSDVGRIFFPFNAGLLLYGNKFYLGVAVHNINKPNISIYENHVAILEPRLTLHTGYCFSPNRNFKITPQILYMKQQVFDVYVIGLQTSYCNFSLGAWYRDNSAVMLNFESLINSIGYQYKNFKFMYSIDYPIKQNPFEQHYSHEVSLIYSLKSKKPVTAKCSALY